MNRRGIVTAVRGTKIYKIRSVVYDPFDSMHTHHVLNYLFKEHFSMILHFYV